MNKLVDAQQQTQVATTGRNPFEAYGEQASQRAITGQLLKFTKGDFVTGENNDMFDMETQLVANMDNFLVGWIRWKENRPTDQVMGKVSTGYQPPRRNELGDNNEDEWELDDRGEPRDPWQFSNYLVLKALDGDEVYTFATSSKGGLNALGELSTTYGKQMRQRLDMFPVVELSVGSYQHSNKSYGRIKYPVFTVVGWAPKAVFDEVTEAVEEGVAAAPPPAVTPPKRAAKPLAAKQPGKDTKF